MKKLRKFLRNYEIDIQSWVSNFGEGHLFLAHREALIPYENNKAVLELDRKALKVIENDKSTGSDRVFLEKLKTIIKDNIHKYTKRMHDNVKIA